MKKAQERHLPPDARQSGQTIQGCIKRTCHFRGDAVLDEARELLLVGFLVLLHQVAHVLGHVDAHDVLAVNLSVELLALWIIPREALGAGGGKTAGNNHQEEPPDFISRHN